MSMPWLRARETGRATVRMYGRCLACGCTTLYGARGLTICGSCLRENHGTGGSGPPAGAGWPELTGTSRPFDSTRAVGVSSGTGRVRAAKSAEGTERGFSARCGEPTRPRPALLREIVTAALVLSLFAALWAVAVMVENGAR